MVLSSRGKRKGETKSEMSKLGKFGRKRVECSWLNQVEGQREGRGEGRVSEARIEVGSYGERGGRKAEGETSTRLDEIEKVLCRRTG